MVGVAPGLSAYTLRFYEREGILAHPVRRDGGPLHRARRGLADGLRDPACLRDAPAGDPWLHGTGQGGRRQRGGATHPDASAS
ncbi:MerR family DNA-binding transcriptional regulator [Plantactinospora soyae]|uniref:MerR family DNA-binding transcriptional regulator n=1 Tax=Plantactinospora soyae TaxID=1544732 RepID=UPI00298ED133|nr:MerR family DNA-binding transcriptional regulator [Plantactinospora soyae]